MIAYDMPSEPALKLFFDGGCRPNPGFMRAAVVARGIVYRQESGHGASSDAEWHALLFALDVAARLGATDIVLVGDSANVIAQAAGSAKVRAAAQGHKQLYDMRSATFARVRLRAVRRTQNLAGIVLQKR